MRLIDADKFKNELITLHEAYKECNSYPMRNKHRWYANMIEELDNQPTVEMAEDCVNVLEQMKELKKDHRHNLVKGSHEERAWKMGIEDCIDILISCSSVTPQPKKGKWDKGYTFPDGEYWKCSECGELIKVKFPMNFCNSCGSDNRGGGSDGV